MHDTRMRLLLPHVQLKSLHALISPCFHSFAPINVVLASISVQRRRITWRLWSRIMLGSVNQKEVHGNGAPKFAPGILTLRQRRLEGLRNRKHSTDLHCM